MKIAIDIDEVLVPFTDPFLKFNGISCEGHEEEKNIIEIIEKDPKKAKQENQFLH